MTDILSRAKLACGLVSCLAATAIFASDDGTPSIAPRDGRIGYVMTHGFWSVYQTPDGKTECPNGYNDGPREQFEQLFPPGGDYTVVDTQLAQELETWHPTTEPDGFVFHEVEGEYSWGLDLDGENGPNDFRHPDGHGGIDNEVYRAVGCIIGFRGPDGVEFVNGSSRSNLLTRPDRHLLSGTGSPAD